MSVVTTQAEFDAALAAGDSFIEIRSPRGVWIQVRTTGSATVGAYGSATVVAYGSATVVAYGSATVRASGSATVRAYDSATVRAYDSATVRAYDSATVRAYDSATVRAYGSAGIHVHHYSKTKAGKFVPVHLHDATAEVEGGVVIDVSKSLQDPRDWCAYHGVEVSKAGIATVYKAVDDNYTTPRGVDYSPGRKPKCDDWSPTIYCGNGLHFSPTPVLAREYHLQATKFLAVGVKVDDLVPILGSGAAKCKAPAVVRACVEVDIHGKPVGGAA